MRGKQRSGSEIRGSEEVLGVFEMRIPKDIQSEGKKYKCSRCGYEWSVRKDSVLYGIRVPFRKFIMVINPFELELSVRKASREL